MVRGAWCVVRGAWCVVRRAWWVWRTRSARPNPLLKQPRLQAARDLSGGRSWPVACRWNVSSFAGSHRARFCLAQLVRVQIGTSVFGDTGVRKLLSPTGSCTTAWLLLWSNAIGPTVSYCGRPAQLAEEKRPGSEKVRDARTDDGTPGLSNLVCLDHLSGTSIRTARRVLGSQVTRGSVSSSR